MTWPLDAQPPAILGKAMFAGEQFGPGPADPPPLWLAKILDGVEVGQTYAYHDTAGALDGYYIDEVDPQTGEVPYPSRTRSAGNDYIVTLGVNVWGTSTWPSGALPQWPLTPGMPVWCWSAIIAGEVEHRFIAPPLPSRAFVATVRTRGWPETVSFGSLSRCANLTATWHVECPWLYFSYEEPADEAFPQAFVNDNTIVRFLPWWTPSAGWPARWRHVLELTPRIPLHDAGDSSGKSLIYADSTIKRLYVGP